MPKKSRSSEENLSAEEYFKRAVELFNQGSHRKAITELNRALRRKAAYPEACNLRGMARALLGELDLAIQDFHRALRYNPQFAPARINRGNLQLELGRPQAAVDDYTEAIRLGIPMQEIAYFHRGVAYYELNQFDQAKRDFDEALSIRSNFPEVYHARGDLHRLRGDLEEAIRDYSEAIRLGATSTVPFVRRAEVLRMQGKYDDAIADYSRVIAVEPKVPDLYVERGRLYDRKGEYEQAIADYQRYVELGGSRTNDSVLNVNRRIFHLRLKLRPIAPRLKDRRWFIS